MSGDRAVQMQGSSGRTGLSLRPAGRCARIRIEEAWWHANRHREQDLRHPLAERIVAKRGHAAAAERTLADEIQRVDAGHLVTRDRTLHQVGEPGGDAVDGDLPAQHRRSSGRRAISPMLEVSPLSPLRACAMRSAALRCARRRDSAQRAPMRPAAALAHLAAMPAHSSAAHAPRLARQCAVRRSRRSAPRVPCRAGTHTAGSTATPTAGRCRGGSAGPRSARRGDLAREQLECLASRVCRAHAHHRLARGERPVARVRPVAALGAQHFDERRAVVGPAEPPEHRPGARQDRVASAPRLRGRVESDDRQLRAAAESFRVSGADLVGRARRRRRARRAPARSSPTAASVTAVKSQVTSGNR